MELAGGAVGCAEGQIDVFLISNIQEEGEDVEAEPAEQLPVEPGILPAAVLPPFFPNTPTGDSAQAMTCFTTSVGAVYA
jgi:hypothetical protein